jgi:septum formation protein
MKIILASNSPRRKELLEKHKISFVVKPSNVNEVIDKNLSVYENVMNLAKIKALDVFNRNQEEVVLAADTIVVYENEILGKPIDEMDAFRMLKLLSGKTHEVITGVALFSEDSQIIDYEVSKVTFNKITEEEILEYIKTKEPMDKAGSYAIQGIGSKFVKSYEGEFDNIVGLPMKLVLKMLNRSNKKTIEFVVQ